MASTPAASLLQRPDAALQVTPKNGNTRHRFIGQVDIPKIE